MKSDIWPSGLCLLALHGCRFSYEVLEREEEPPGVGGSVDVGGAGGASPTCSDDTQNQGESGVDCGGPCTPCSPTECTLVVADSVLDFSMTQGQAGWHYGYVESPALTSEDFIEFAQFGPIENLGEDAWFISDMYWTAVGASGMHPNGLTTTEPKTGIDQFAIRRWISSETGALFVDGQLFGFDNSSNGLAAEIRVEGEQVFGLTLPPAQTEPIDFETVITVAAGDRVDFVLDPFESNDLADSTSYEVRICL
jgi:hypothetical protein